jgi:hypothetical protein
MHVPFLLTHWELQNPGNGVKKRAGSGAGSWLRFRTVVVWNSVRWLNLFLGFIQWFFSNHFNPATCQQQIPNLRVPFVCYSNVSFKSYGV